MTDWNLLARALGLDIPEQEVARAAVSLGALEDAVRPLTANLTVEIEPAVVFSCPGEDGR